MGAFIHEGETPKDRQLGLLGPVIRPGSPSLI
jgi:hypothetical protein